MEHTFTYCGYAVDVSKEKCSACFYPTVTKDGRFYLCKKHFNSLDRALKAATWKWSEKFKKGKPNFFREHEINKV